MSRTIAILLAALAGCAGPGLELDRPVRRVAILPPEGEVLAPEESAAFRRAAGDVLRSRACEVSDATGLRGDPWTWDPDVRESLGVDAILRSRMLKRPYAELQLVDAFTGRTLWLATGPVEEVLARLPSMVFASEPAVELPASVVPPTSVTSTWPVTEGFKARLGGNTFIDVPVPVQYGGWPLVTLARLPDGTLGVDLDVHDSGGQVLARVRSSRLSGREAGRFLATRTDDRWTLTEKGTGAVLCDLRKGEDAGGTVVDVALRLRAPDGTLWDATADDMDLRPLRFKHNVFNKCRVGIALGPRP